MRRSAIPILATCCAALRLLAGPAAGLVAEAGVAAAADSPPVAPEVRRAAESTCRPAAGIAILAVPRAPVAGEPLRVVAASAGAIDAALVVYAPDGSPVARGEPAHAPPAAAPPLRWVAEVVAPESGLHRAVLESPGEIFACAEIDVAADRPRPRSRPANVVWPVERDWDRGLESLYSAFVAQLFDDPLDAEPSWRGMAVLGDPERNLLFDHLGLGEDSGRGLRLEPDCADLPYFLRAYFSWKLGLPFGYSSCSRGSAGAPPRCGAWHSSLDPPVRSGGGDAEVFRAFLARSVADAVHSGSGRTPLADDESDLYPTRLAPESIAPGAVFADPYGHTLIVVRRIPQTAESGGMLLAVDAQPDGTVARKRYWRGNFLFADDPRLGGAGFKRFRPVVRDGGRLRPLANREIATDPDYGDVSLEQGEVDVETFYDRMDDLLSPEPLDPSLAFRQAIDALDEQVRARVRSVENGEEWVARNPGTVAMPPGASIFETTGPWEDYATPSRDLRLLIAIDVVRDFPERVGRRPERYAIAQGRSLAEVRRELEALLRDEAARRTFEYRRSDGSSWTLSLGDVLDRAEALEVAYNPNDCAERRWGAPASSAEAATCRRRAPKDQAARMEEVRDWFRERRRPPRA